MGPQGDGVKAILDAVFPVTGQRPAPGGELHPDLVGAARVETNADKGVSFTALQHPIAQLCLPHILAGCVGHIGHPPLPVPAQQVAEGAFLRRRTVNHRQILFLEPTVPDLLAQQGGRPG